MTDTDTRRNEHDHDAARPRHSTPAPTPHHERSVRVTVATSEAWRAAISADRSALPEQSPEWIEAICSVGRAADASRAYAFADGTSVVLPLVRTGPPGIGSMWSPPPAWGIGGTVGPDLDVHHVGAIIHDLRTIAAPRVAVRVDARHDHLWRHACGPRDILLPRRSHIVDIAGTAEEHLAGLGKTARYRIRRAARNDVSVAVDRSGDLLDTHYELFLRSVRRWAAKQHEPESLALVRARRRDPLGKLRAMQRALGHRMLTLVSYVGDRPASSAIVLLGPTSRYTRGAMDAELAGPVFANYALQSRAIEEVYDFGSRRYHMGESGESDGISQFKEKFGAVPIEHHEYRFERVPVTRGADLARRAVKRVIGFRD